MAKNFDPGTRCGGRGAAAGAMGGRAGLRGTQCLAGYPVERVMTKHASHMGDQTSCVVVAPARCRRGTKLAPWQIKIAQTEMTDQARGRLRIDAIAAKLELSATHFAKAFKNAVGVTPRCWHERVRISQAMRLLQDPQLTVAEIAAECGFTDESHLSVRFSLNVGISPGRWRRRERARQSEGLPPPRH